MIYETDSTLFRRFLIPTCPDDNDLLDDSWKGINRQWKKDLRAVYMGCTSLLLAILKPLDQWTPRSQRMTEPLKSQKLLQDKCSELAENCVEELRLAAEDDYPSDTVSAAKEICAALLAVKNLCRECGVPKLKRRRWAIRSD